MSKKGTGFSFELTTVLTRFGEDSKYIVVGDSLQSDINGKSGYRAMSDRFADEESKAKGIHTYRFGIADIKRSELLKFIIKRLEETN